MSNVDSQAERLFSAVKGFAKGLITSRLYEQDLRFRVAEKFLRDENEAMRRQLEELERRVRGLEDR